MNLPRRHRGLYTTRVLRALSEACNARPHDPYVTTETVADTLYSRGVWPALTKDEQNARVERNLRMLYTAGTIDARDDTWATPAAAHLARSTT